jgi:hypothetical protein
MSTELDRCDSGEIDPGALRARRQAMAFEGAVSRTSVRIQVKSTHRVNFLTLGVRTGQKVYLLPELQKRQSARVLLVT